MTTFSLSQQHATVQYLDDDDDDYTPTPMAERIEQAVGNMEQLVTTFSLWAGASECFIMSNFV